MYNIKTGCKLLHLPWYIVSNGKSKAANDSKYIASNGKSKAANDSTKNKSSAMSSDSF